MELTVGILVFLALGYGVYRLLKLRARSHAEGRAKAEKSAKDDHADAKALRKSLDGRR